jgi:hypothetical protein
MCSMHLSEVLATCSCPISAIVGAKHGLLSSQHRDATSCTLHKTQSNELRKEQCWVISGVDPAEPHRQSPSLCKILIKVSADLPRRSRSIGTRCFGASQSSTMTNCAWIPALGIHQLENCYVLFLYLLRLLNRNVGISLNFDDLVVGHDMMTETRSWMGCACTVIVSARM